MGDINSVDSDDANGGGGGNKGGKGKGGGKGGGGGGGGTNGGNEPGTTLTVRETKIEIHPVLCFAMPISSCSETIVVVKVGLKHKNASVCSISKNKGPSLCPVLRPIITSFAFRLIGMVMLESLENFLDSYRFLL